MYAYILLRMFQGHLGYSDSRVTASGHALLLGVNSFSARYVNKCVERCAIHSCTVKSDPRERGNP